MREQEPVRPESPAPTETRPDRPPAEEQDRVLYGFELLRNQMAAEEKLERNRHNPDAIRKAAEAKAALERHLEVMRAAQSPQPEPDPDNEPIWGPKQDAELERIWQEYEAQTKEWNNVQRPDGLSNDPDQSIEPSR